MAEYRDLYNFTAPLAAQKLIYSTGIKILKRRHCRRLCLEGGRLRPPSFILLINNKMNSLLHLQLSPSLLFCFPFSVRSRQIRPKNCRNTGNATVILFSAEKPDTAANKWQHCFFKAYGILMQIQPVSFCF